MFSLERLLSWTTISTHLGQIIHPDDQEARHVRHDKKQAVQGCVEREVRSNGPIPGQVHDAIEGPAVHGRKKQNPAIGGTLRGCSKRRLTETPYRGSRVGRVHRWPVFVCPAMNSRTSQPGARLRRPRAPGEGNRGGLPHEQPLCTDLRLLIFIVLRGAPACQQ